MSAEALVNISGVPVPLPTGSKRSGDLVDVAIPVRLEQPADQSLGMSAHNPLLPIAQLDSALVFPPRAMLWEETNPVLPMWRHIDTALPRNERHMVRPRENDGVSCYLVDDVRIFQIAGDPQPEDVPRKQSQADVT